MQLEAGGTVQFDDPDPLLVEATLRTLHQHEEPFAILSRDDTHFLQTAMDLDRLFGLEYQDGSIDNHYSAVRHDLDLETIVRVFTLYAQGDERWQTELEWERMEL